MVTETVDRGRVIVYYAVWVSVCAAVTGLVVALLHTAFFSYHPGRAATLHTLTEDAVTALALAAGQGAVALVTASVLSRLGRGLSMTVLLGLVIGAFDLAMYLLQMLVPATELGWRGDVAVLVAVTAAMTVWGAGPRAGAE